MDRSLLLPTESVHERRAESGTLDSSSIREGRTSVLGEGQEPSLSLTPFCASQVPSISWKQPTDPEESTLHSSTNTVPEGTLHPSKPDHLTWISKELMSRWVLWRTPRIRRLLFGSSSCHLGRNVRDTPVVSSSLIAAGCLTTEIAVLFEPQCSK